MTLIGSFLASRRLNESVAQLRQASQESLEASISLAGQFTRLKPPQENLFPFEPDPNDKFPEEIIYSIDPRLLTLSPSPEAEAGDYYNTQNLTQYDYHSFSESSLDNSSSPYLADSEIGDSLTGTVDEAQPATPVQKYNNSTSGQSPAHSLNTNCSAKFLCSDCGKGFELPCHLRKHEKYHVKDRPCNIRNCTKRFARERDLQRHRGDVHPESFPSLAKRYRCPRGDYESNREDNLKRHMEAKHPEEPIPANWKQAFLKRK
ncbi:hypothetical protein GX50_06912 [[Emmonsia] crescens]|uniref:C2H2-type domain-containing protein n=1 Tax=[Emmonsia] crescens TaxID=73230 RepID=A0A2B7ZAZ7_9EURO|nr:hypothetical protein GX50_06912 [Emmonsia crescens]